jgi:peptidoglycan-associated lipoprotein
MKAQWHQFMVLVMMLACIALVSGCAKERIESRPTGLQAETGAETEAPAKTSEELAAEEARKKAEEYELQQAEAEEAAEAARQAEEEARSADLSQLRERIHFDFDSYELKPQDREILKEKAAILRSRQDIELMIEGHCDERGTEEYNLALGERRARAAYEYLILLGISPDRMSIISYGEEKPLDPGHNEEAWAKNRRAQFRIKD